MSKIIRLSVLRNELASEKFGEEDKQLMNNIKQDILNLNTPFKELAINAINNCEQDIRNNKFKSAVQEIQLIHNFTFNDFNSWNEDYFYKIELLSYIEIINSKVRIEKLISLKYIIEIQKLISRLPLTS